MIVRGDELVEVLCFEYRGRCPGGPESPRFVRIVAGPGVSLPPFSLATVITKHQLSEVYH
jgi:hypothetical protein